MCIHNNLHLLHFQDNLCQDFNESRADFSGCTAIVVAVCDKGDRIFCANLGDCRGVICRDGTAHDISEDHKASNDREAQRIIAAGGCVRKGRVNGILAVSRAFGDIEYKRKKVEYWEEELKEDLVIAKPEVREFILHETDQFIVLACDGIWDVLSSQQVCNFVWRRLLVHADAKRAACELCNKALEMNSRDNCSVVVICLNQPEVVTKM